MKSPRLILLCLAAIALIGGCGKSSQLPSAVENTLDSTPPPVPEHLSVSTNPSVAGGVLTWSESSSPDVAGYMVFEYSPDPARETSYVQVFEGQANVTSWALAPVTESTVRYFRICAVDESGNRSAMSPVLQTTLWPSPRIQDPGPTPVPFGD